MKGRKRPVPVAIVFALTIALSTSAAAELYRCTDASGREIFTGDPHACRGKAERHETQRQIQRSGPASVAPLPRRVPRMRPGGPPNHGAASLWQRKKAEAEEQYRKLDAELPRWARLQANCNRGAETWYTDDAGIKHTIPCSELAAEHERARAEHARLRAYLEEGLEEECRRAGCLPGWIR